MTCSLSSLRGCPQVQKLAHAPREDAAFRGQHDLVFAALVRINACGHPLQTRLMVARGVPDVEDEPTHDALGYLRHLGILVDAAALVGGDHQERIHAPNWNNSLALDDEHLD